MDDIIEILERVDPSAIGHYRVESYQNLLWHFHFSFERNPERVHEAAVIVLGMIGPKAKEAIPVLIEVSKDESYILRREAMRALGRIGPTAEAVLETLLKAGIDEDPQAGSYALEALSETDPKWLNRFHLMAFFTSLPGKCINARDRKAAIKLLKLVTQVVTQVEEDALVREAAEKALEKMARDDSAPGTMGTTEKGGSNCIDSACRLVTLRGT